MFKGRIYLIRNKLDLTRYTGQTILTVEQRLNKHKTTARSKRGNTLLYKAMLKDGFENFIIEELACISCETENALSTALGNLEAYYAEQYDTYLRSHVDCSYNMCNTPDGYNMTPCGNGFAAGRIVPTDEKEKLADRMRNRIVSQETRDKIRNTNLNNPREWTQEERDAAGDRARGRIATPETCATISKAKLGKKRRPDECAAISKAKKGKPLTDKQIAAQKLFNEARFDKLFNEHLEQFIKDPSTEKQWRYDMTRKKKDKRLDNKYIIILNNTPTFTWSS